MLGRAKTNIAFIIEGATPLDLRNADSSVTEFPDIIKSTQLAKSLNAQVTDIVASIGDSEFTEKLFNSMNKEDGPIVAMHLIKLMSPISKNYNYLIDNFIKAPLKKAKFTLPAWLKNFSEETFVKIYLSIPQRSEKITQCVANIQLVSSKISTDRLLNYLKQNPQIDTLYALVGRAHADDFNQITSSVESLPTQHPDDRVIRFSLNNKKITLFLFGGTHQTLEHYERMENCVKNNTKKKSTPASTYIVNQTIFDIKHSYKENERINAAVSHLVNIHSSNEVKIKSYPPRLRFLDEEFRRKELSSLLVSANLAFEKKAQIDESNLEYIFIPPQLSCGI